MLTAATLAHEKDQLRVDLWIKTDGIKITATVEAAARELDI
jgi:hypothetical protein